MGKFTTKFTEEQEKAILSLYVTHVSENIFFVKDTLPPEQWATLGAAYSRTHEPFQARLLKAIENEDIDVSILDDLLKNKQSLSNEKLAEKARKFIQKWAQEYGHNSIKELGMVRFCVEHAPDLTLTKIAAHPLAHLQVKSSRYLDWQGVLPKIASNSDIQNSIHGSKIMETLKEMCDGYIKITENAAKYVENSFLNKKFLSEKMAGMPLAEIRKNLANFKESARNTVLDSTRYLLTTSMPTSCAVSVDTRALEEIITDLLSSQLLEDQRVGKELLEKGRHIEPVLLGEKCHAKKSDYIIETRKELEAFVKKIIGNEKERDYRVYPIPKRVKMFSDLQIASNIAFANSNFSFMHIYDELKKNPKHAEAIINIAFKNRGDHDPVNNEINHGGLMVEFFMDYGGYRDVHRHRRGTKTLQRLTTNHGFEVPKLIEIAGLKNDYEKLMHLSQASFKNLEMDNPYVAQLVVPFGFKCRSLFSWGIAQWMYFTELRSTDKGNISYRQIAWEMEEVLKKRVPYTAKNLRVNKILYPPELINAQETRKWYNENIRNKQG